MSSDSVRLAPLAALLVLPLADGRSFRLSPPGELIPSGDVLEALVTPDEQRIVYFETFDFANGGSLYSVPRDGSAPRVLVSGDAYPFDALSGITISPDSGRVLYLKGDIVDRMRLFSAPLDGSAPPVELAGPNVSSFRVTSDSSRVVFRADLFTPERFLLWSVPIAGGALLEESGPCTAAADVEEYELTSDGAFAVYRADAVTNNTHELFSAPIGPASGHLRLNPPPTVGSLAIFRLSPDGARAVYLADFVDANLPELFSVPVDGTASAVKLNVGGAGRDVQSDFAITPDSSRVVFRSVTSGNVTRLFSAAIAGGGGGATHLTPVLPAAGDVASGLRVSPDSARAVFRADALTDQLDELFAAPLDGSAPPVRLNPDLAPGELLYIAHTTVLDAARAAFVAGSIGGPVLYVAPLDGAAPATPVDAAPFSTFQSILADPDGLHVFYVRDDGDPQRLFRGDLSGATPPVALSDGTSVQFSLVGGGAGVVYVSDDDVRNGYEAFARSAHPPGPAVQVSEEMPHDRDAVSVVSFRAAGGRALYVGNSDGSQFHALHSIPIAEGHLPLVLSELSSPPIDVEPSFGSLAVAAGGARAVFRGVRHGLQIELFGVPVDGSSPPAALNPPLPGSRQVFSFTVSPDGSRALYLANQDADAFLELYRVPVDGSAAAVKLNGPLVANGDVSAWVANADASRVAYLADQAVNDRLEAYSADGVAPAVKLSGGLRVAPETLLLSPDGARVFYRADTAGDYALYGAPLDGSAPQVALSGTMVAGADVEPGTRVTPDGAHVLFLADREVLNRIDLYVAPADGSAPPLRLNTPIVAHDVVSVHLDPAGTRAVYHLANDLYVVPVDGSAPPLLLSAGVPDVIAASFSPPGIEVTADGTRVLFRVDLATQRLYAAPLDGSAPPQLISAQHGASTLVRSFLLTPDGESAVYVASFGPSSVLHAFLVPVDRRREPVALHAPLQAGLGVLEHELARGGEALLMRLDAETPGAFALYAALLERQPRRKALGPP